MAGSFAWNSQKYIDLVENGSDAGLQAYQKAEIDYLTTKVKHREDKTFIDVGAGYGRILPHLSSVAKKVVAVEIDDNLEKTLVQCAKVLPNCEVVKGYANQLSDLVKDLDIPNPVVVSVQNCLGPWIGDRFAAVAEMRRVAERGKGEVIISLFRREAIKDWGLQMYDSVSGLLGEYDPRASDLENGIYITKTGYESYWFSKEEREEIKNRLRGKLVAEVIDSNFHIIHVSYE